MKRLQWLAVTTGIVALAGCDASEDVNMTNIEVNAADENLALPPVDMNMTTDMNADMNMTTDMNATDDSAINTAENTTNAY